MHTFIHSYIYAVMNDLHDTYIHYIHTYILANMYKHLLSCALTQQPCINVYLLMHMLSIRTYTWGI